MKGRDRDRVGEKVEAVIVTFLVILAASDYMLFSTNNTSYNSYHDSSCTTAAHHIIIKQSSCWLNNKQTEKKHWTRWDTIEILFTFFSISMQRALCFYSIRLLCPVCCCFPFDCSLLSQISYYRKFFVLFCVFSNLPKPIKRKTQRQNFFNTRQQQQNKKLSHKKNVSTTSTTVTKPKDERKKNHNKNETVSKSEA